MLHQNEKKIILKKVGKYHGAQQILIKSYRPRVCHEDPSIQKKYNNYFNEFIYARIICEPDSF